MTVADLRRALDDPRLAATHEVIIGSPDTDRWSNGGILRHGGHNQGFSITEAVIDSPPTKTRVLLLRTTACMYPEPPRILTIADDDENDL